MTSDQRLENIETEVTALRNDFSTLRGDFTALKIELVELRMDVKHLPDRGQLYQAILAVNAGMLASVVALVVIGNAFGFIGS